MQEILRTLLYPVGVALFMLPLALVLILASVVANLLSGMYKPITEPLQAVMETASERVPNPLDKIPSFPKIKRYFGSTKNILFICFVIIFLLFHYLSLESGPVSLLNISTLFPGSAFDIIISFAINQGKVDYSSIVINPEDYLQTIIFSGITGLFLHMGCTTKAKDAKIHFAVRLLYILLITLFSSVVLGKIPPDMFTVTLPAYSSQLESASIVIDIANPMTLLTALQQAGEILLKNLVTIIPTLVAVYFLCQSISSFTAAFMGGFFALAALSMACPDVFLNPYSFKTSVLLLVAVSLAEATALLFGEFINKMVARVFENFEKIFAYYNIISLSFSYFFYPALALPVITYISAISRGLSVTNSLICIACLFVFSLSTFASYKINQWVWARKKGVNGKKYAIFMVINIPILIIYSLMFNI